MSLQAACTNFSHNRVQNGPVLLLGLDSKDEQLIEKVSFPLVLVVL